MALSKEVHTPICTRCANADLARPKRWMVFYSRALMNADGANDFGGMAMHERIEAFWCAEDCALNVASAFASAGYECIRDAPADEYPRS